MAQAHATAQAKYQADAEDRWCRKESPPEVTLIGLAFEWAGVGQRPSWATSCLAVNPTMTRLVNQGLFAQEGPVLSDGLTCIYVVTDLGGALWNAVIRVRCAREGHPMDGWPLEKALAYLADVDSVITFGPRS